MLSLLLAATLTDWPLTKAERTDYKETSTYADVVEYMETLEKLGAPMRVTWIGVSTENRKIPLAIVSDPPVRSADEARAQGKLIVYVQGNIHAGEVEGKEAAQILLRRIAQDREAKRPGLLKDMVLLVNPIYNADGNEKFGPVERNRPEQDGPALVGVRPNGQNFDLNRDCIKAESPEMRAVLEHINGKWDPDALLDLHTTDGTRHGYDLTYSPPLNPNTDSNLRRYAQDRLLADVRKLLKRRFGTELFDYGNAENSTTGRAWRTFGQEGRYVTNYAGLCNRVGILSEATVYIPFRDRIIATDIFMRAVLDHLAKSKDSIRKWRKEAKLPAELGVRFEMAEGRREGVLLEKLAPGEPRPRGGRPKALETVEMPVFDRFKTTRTSKVPKAYLVPQDALETVRLLQRHGIRLERVSEAWMGKGARFTISEFKQANQAFQGHKLITLEGKFEDAEIEAKPNEYFRVPTNQPLGGLAFYILEPECLDGAAAWGFLGEKFEVGSVYPVLKVW